MKGVPKICIKLCVLKWSIKEEKWYLDSRCARHVTGDRSMFSHLMNKDGGHDPCGDCRNCTIVGEGDICTLSSKIHDVLLIVGLSIIS